MTGSYVNSFPEPGNWAFLENSSAQSEKLAKKGRGVECMCPCHLQALQKTGLPINDSTQEATI
jgi:hypothetical protein